MTHARLIELLDRWIQGLALDAEAMLSLLARNALPATSKRAVIGGLSYLLRPVELIPDGVEAIGYADECLVLRVAAAQALADCAPDETLPLAVSETLGSLAQGVAVVRELLGDDYQRFDHYVSSLPLACIRRRNAGTILSDREAFVQFVADIRAFVRGYTPPTTPMSPRALLMLTAYLDAKLPVDPYEETRTCA